MQLVDPVSQSRFAPAKLAKLPGVGSIISEFWIRKARAAARSLSWDPAAIAYSRALRFRPGNGKAWIQFGHALGHTGKARAAAIAYRNATVAAPWLNLGHKHLGMVKRGTGLHESSLPSLAAALLLDPTDTKLRATLLEDMDDIGLENRLASAALVAGPRSGDRPVGGLRGALLLSRARAAGRRRDWATAERLFGELADLRPHDSGIFTQLGHALNEQQKAQEAELAYRRAIACSPLQPDAWLHLGYVLTARKLHLQARAAFSFANRLAPTLREDHPIMDAAVQAEHEWNRPGQEAAISRLTCPEGLDNRTKGIWLCLASQLEGNY